MLNGLSQDLHRQIYTLWLTCSLWQKVSKLQRVKGSQAGGERWVDCHIVRMLVFIFGMFCHSYLFVCFVGWAGHHAHVVRGWPCEPPALNSGHQVWQQESYLLSHLTGPSTFHFWVTLYNMISTVNKEYLKMPRGNVRFSLSKTCWGSKVAVIILQWTHKLWYHFVFLLFILCTYLLSHLL